MRALIRQPLVASGFRAWSICRFGGAFYGEECPQKGFVDYGALSGTSFVGTSWLSVAWGATLGCMRFGKLASWWSNSASAMSSDTGV